MEQTAIRAAIERTSAALAQSPAKARSTAAPLSARLVDGLSFEVRGAGGETVRTDMPQAMGGEAGAPSPGWLMRASLAAWGDAHSPVACTLRAPPALSTEVEIVR
ncbi:MAG: OsmC family protein [Burkholderiales bacterium]